MKVVFASLVSLTSDLFWSKVETDFDARSVISGLRLVRKFDFRVFIVVAVNVVGTNSYVITIIIVIITFVVSIGGVVTTLVVDVMDDEVVVVDFFASL